MSSISCCKIVIKLYAKFICSRLGWMEVDTDWELSCKSEIQIDIQK
jgi:hypothetical protein